MESWRGIPREEIPWFPTVDETKCIGCRECLEICKNAVFSFDDVFMKSKVVRPFNCVIECRTCAKLCPADAISFPEEKEFSDLIKEKLVKI